MSAADSTKKREDPCRHCCSVLSLRILARVCLVLCSRPRADREAEATEIGENSIRQKKSHIWGTEQTSSRCSWGRRCLVSSAGKDVWKSEGNLSWSSVMVICPATFPSHQCRPICETNMSSLVMSLSRLHMTISCDFDSLPILRFDSTTAITKFFTYFTCK
jgi:hypothetical protein